MLMLTDSYNWPLRMSELTQADRGNRFSEIYDDCFEHINDEKLTTGQCCVQNSIKITRSKPQLKEQIASLLLDLDNRCTYPQRQKELLRYDVLEVLDDVYEGVSDRQSIDEFVRACTRSVSPKTRRKAKELVSKYDL